MYEKQVRLSVAVSQCIAFKNKTNPPGNPKRRTRNNLNPPNITKRSTTQTEKKETAKKQVKLRTSYANSSWAFPPPKMLAFLVEAGAGAAAPTDCWPAALDRGASFSFGRSPAGGAPVAPPGTSGPPAPTGPSAPPLPPPLSSLRKRVRHISYQLKRKSTVDTSIIERLLPFGVLV